MKIIEKRGKFAAIDDNSKEIGKLIYRSSDEGIWTIRLVYVKDEFRKQGVGNLLLNSAIEAARNKGVKILPICPFAKAQMEKNLEKYSDILHSP